MRSRASTSTRSQLPMPMREGGMWNVERGKGKGWGGMTDLLKAAQQLHRVAARGHRHLAQAAAEQAGGELEDAGLAWRYTVNVKNSVRVMMRVRVKVRVRANVRVRLRSGSGLGLG